MMSFGEFWLWVIGWGFCVIGIFTTFYFIREWRLDTKSKEVAELIEGMEQWMVNKYVLKARKK